MKTLRSIALSATLVMIVLLLSSCGPDKKKAKKMMDKGVREMYNARYKESLEYLNQAIEEDPKLTEAYYYRGCVRFRMKETAKAIEDLNQVITFDPKQVEAYATLGDIFYYLGDKKKACGCWKKAEELGKPNMRDKVRYCE
ncbi:MAG: tetratricopeptide repeat protein [Bacteroidetes bacterium]|nr:tetratricopeptide repeat protein [Bacteroidota bacterium]